MNTITVGAYEAKTNLARLLSRVAKGTEVIITRHERPIARLSAIEPKAKLQRSEVLRRMKELAEQVKPGPESAKDLVNAGRRL